MLHMDLCSVSSSLMCGRILVYMYVMYGPTGTPLNVFDNSKICFMLIYLLLLTDCFMNKKNLHEAVCKQIQIN